MLKLFLDQTDEIPWDALLFVTGHINYGGRVTDDLDRRCLLTILEKFCQNACLSDSYKYTPSGIYYGPADGKVEVYRDYIDQLPMVDNPEIFGLHENANINYNIIESDRVIETVLGIQPRLQTAAGGLTPDEIVLEKSKEFLDNLPELLDQKTGLKELFIQDSQGLIPSLSTVLLQEMEKFNNLLTVMRKSLIEIDLAIKGFIVMSEVIDKMYLAIINNKVPTNWSDVGYPSLKPLSSWYADLIVRVDTMDVWLKNGNPMCYWMPGMFFPQGFMTGVLQTHAREFKIAIDRLDFTFEIQDAERPDEIEEAPKTGVMIYGLFIDGARWDRENQIITDQYPAKMVETMPIVWFKPQEDYKPDPDEYQAPLYKTSVRAGVLSTTGQSTNYVLNVAMPSKESPALWVQRAAALLCMLND